VLTSTNIRNIKYFKDECRTMRVRTGTIVELLGKILLSMSEVLSQ
jgi:hypothetical protein